MSHLIHQVCYYRRTGITIILLFLFLVSLLGLYNFQICFYYRWFYCNVMCMNVARDGVANAFATIVTIFVQGTTLFSVNAFVLIVTFLHYLCNFLKWILQWSIIWDYSYVITILFLWPMTLIQAANSCSYFCCFFFVYFPLFRIHHSSPFRAENL